VRTIDPAEVIEDPGLILITLLKLGAAGSLRLIMTGVR
jgi:hypothetical protein